jgi:hypothetical protein
VANQPILNNQLIVLGPVVILENDGKEIMNASEQVSPLAEVQIETHTAANMALPVFATVLKQFLIQLELIDAKVTRKLRQSVLAQISLCLSSLEERQNLNAWIIGNTEQLQIKIGLVNMQNCIHHAYISACDYFGPSRADEILNQIIKDTESLPIAREFAPGNLL